jgi:hypothetical protein
MNQEEALMLMSCRLYDLLGKMFSMFRRWMPQTDFPRCSAGMSSGGVVGYESADELDLEADHDAIRVLEAGWDDLSAAERTVIEVVLGRQPDVWTVRHEVYETAIAKLEKRLRMIGVV